MKLSAGTKLLTIAIVAVSLTCVVLALLCQPAPERITAAPPRTNRSANVGPLRQRQEQREAAGGDSLAPVAVRRDAATPDNGETGAQSGQKNEPAGLDDPANGRRTRELCESILSGDWEKRIEASLALTALGEAATGNLVALLSDPKTPLVALPDILTALGEIKDPAAAPAIAKLASHAHPEIRRCAIVVLAKLGQPESLPVLLARCSEDKAAEVRAAAVQGIARVATGNNAEVVQRLCQLVDSADEDERVRTNAITALGKLGGPAAVEALSAILGGKRASQDTDAAVMALAETGDATAMSILRRYSDALTTSEPQDEQLRCAWRRSVELIQCAMERLSSAQQTQFP